MRVSFRNDTPRVPKRQLTMNGTAVRSRTPPAKGTPSRLGTGFGRRRDKRAAASARAARHAAAVAACPGSLTVIVASAMTAAKPTGAASQDQRAYPLRPRRARPSKSEASTTSRAEP
jgi:hypothetical protein